MQFTETQNLEQIMKYNLETIAYIWHLAPKYARIFVRGGHYKFREAKSFATRAKFKETCDIRGTEYVEES